MKTFTTPKGTELKIIDLKGKDYLEVQQRVIWFREERPNWTIETSIVSTTDTHCVTLCRIKDETGRLIATSHKQATKAGAGPVAQFFIERAETGSIGRALALCGYGTQFCGEDLDEGEEIADAPVERTRLAAPQDTQSRPQQTRSEAVMPFRFGGKDENKGKPLSQFSQKDLLSAYEFVTGKGKDIYGKYASSIEAQLSKKNAEEEIPF